MTFPQHIAEALALIDQETHDEWPDVLDYVRETTKHLEPEQGE